MSTTPLVGMPMTPGNGSPSTGLGDQALTALESLFFGASRVLVLTGAGCSTDSGIPDYRDRDGAWKRRPPVQFRDFVGSEAGRRRYWARSLVGWARMGGAEPNDAHKALARLTLSGPVHQVVTQNVDGLHQRAGTRHVIDLHGRLDAVVCLDCGARFAREAFQVELAELNPGWASLAHRQAPDGDADLGGVDYAAFRVPDCRCCGGMLKPDVVFFGENVARGVVDRAFAALDGSDLLLIAGSSLMVWSGYRFVRRAVQRGIPVAIVNLGRTRGDGEAAVKVASPCGEVLPRLAARCGRYPPVSPDDRPAG